MKLKKIIIHKYKSIETEQTFDVDNNITVLVGMNESGKTSILEAIGKTNYFQKDKKFKFDPTHDYPRREKKKMDKTGADPDAVTATYSIDSDTRALIDADVGSNVFSQDEVIVTNRYSNGRSWVSVRADRTKFIEEKTTSLGISSATLNDKLLKVNTKAEFEALVGEYQDEKILGGLAQLKKYFQNSWGWAKDPIGEYIARELLTPRIPKYLYYDEYYALPSRISIENLTNEELDDEEQKTAKALFELADINIQELIDADDYEDFKAELEATQATITDELFKYWETNKNIEIEFNIDKVEDTVERKVANPDGGPKVSVADVKIIEHVLDIRVKNTRSRVSLPLKNRSKGFNWFFSFLVWFKKIQEDKKHNYVLLLDEPGMNLHASAQSDLLRFLRDLSVDYQIIYTTHSPFMIESTSLNNVRTIVETENGSVISESLQEKDPKTLFPLQAALGYDIAQNLFVSKNNLLVEGPADLVYLTVLSNLLEKEKRTHLDSEVTIVPVGGLDKVATFISLLRGSKLNVASILDSFKNPKGRQKVDDLIKNKIIKEKNIRFFDEFAENGKVVADIEDMFEKDEYIKLFNLTFASEHKKLKLSDLDKSRDKIIEQINATIGKDRFNHYKPANKLAQLGVDKEFFSDATLTRFEKMFDEMNKLFR